MNKKNTIAAVVVTYNRKELLVECINALLKQTHKLDAIYIIDNASNDGTKEYLKEKKLLDKIKYFRLKKNTGGAGGFNYGIDKAYKNYAWIWAMDDDAIVYKDALEKLVNNKYYTDSKVGALVCNTIYSKYLSFKISITLSAAISNEKIFQNRKLNLEDFDNNFVRISTFSLLGILFRTNIIEEIGNVNKDFFIESDDLDFTLRISKKYKIIWVKNSRLLHKVHPELYLTKKILSRNIGYIDYKTLWKVYYGSRNHLYIMKINNLSIRINIIGYIKEFIFISFFLDHKILRLKIFKEALIDGYKGNLGIKYTPQNFLKKDH